MQPEIQRTPDNRLVPVRTIQLESWLSWPLLLHA